MTNLLPRSRTSTCRPQAPRIISTRNEQEVLNPQRMEPQSAEFPNPATKTSAQAETLAQAETARADSLATAKLCARILDEQKMDDIKIFDVRDSLQITDCFVIATGRNPRHVRTAGDRLAKELREQGIQRRGLEGRDQGRWVLLDLNDVVVHLFLVETRQFYDLELLWGDSPTVDPAIAGRPDLPAGPPTGLPTDSAAGSAAGSAADLPTDLPTDSAAGSAADLPTDSAADLPTDPASGATDSRA